MDADGNVRLYVVDYLGFTPMDKRFSKPMLPWVIAEIKRRGSTDTVCLSVVRGKLLAYHGSELMFSHSLSLFTRYGYVHGDYSSFLYVLRDPSTPQVLTCHLFRAEDPSDVVELFSAMREQSKDSMAAVKERSLSSAAALSCEISLNTSHYFEVLYVGRIKITHKKVPESFIDDALEKFHMHEAEKEKLKSQKLGNSQANRHHGSAADLPSNKDESASQQVSESSENLISATSSSVTPTSSNSPTGSVEVLPTNGEQDKVGGGSENQVTNSAASHKQIKQLPQMEPMRSRAASTGSARELKRSESSAVSNRTMLFLVGRMDLRLISPDRKQTVLHKHLKDVAYCIQGIKNPEHFGFICSEANVDHYVAYVFKCQSASVADDVVGAITQAFLATSEAQRREKLPVYSCDHCPMMWYHKLCSEVDGHTERVVHTIIMRRLESLPQSEQDSILAKYHGAETQGLRDQNEFLMMLLRAHCENKQARHIHDTAENRHEFLNQYLGGSTIFMKAKRSLTNSFDHLLKRKGSRDDFGPILKEMSLPMNATLCKDGISTEQHVPVTPNADETEESESKTTTSRPRASTITSTEIRLPSNLNPPQKESPMKNIFLKVGNSPLTPVKPNQDISRQSGSWRQVIFKSVTPNKVRPDGSCDDPNVQLPRVKRDASELRALWRKAINQQLLLIRMDKENARLQARQEEATVKRIKLEYDEITICAREVVEVWDVLVSREASASSRCDRQLLLHAIKQGVPRTKRGEVWQFLADQHCFNTAPPDITKFPNYNVPYDNLLKQLTSHQHAILIDLGRTFPNHPYYSSPLGPGQLALFNILKAYSLLDPEVGYCQGLSFVAGVLLLHMPEENTFLLLKHLMLRRGMRRQYLPNMGALQVQLYQLSRLLHDQFPDLYSHFDTHDVAPTLYAAPWVLTLFASQFPLGFVARVFDLLFFDSAEAIFRVALALFSEHKKELLMCQSFEETMDYLKNQIPNIDRDTLDRIMKQVFTMDISKQLHEYEVEYHVLKEESNVPHADIETLQRVEAENRHLAEQLQISANNSHRLQTTVSKLEGQVRSLEVTISALGSFIMHLTESKADIEIPDDIRRIVSQLAHAETRKVPNTSVSEKHSHPSKTAELAKYSDLPEKSSSVGSELQIFSKRQYKGAPYPLKSALSSPNLSAKLTGMFSNSQNNKQIKSVGTDMSVPSSKTNTLCLSHSNGNLKTDNSCKIESCKNDSENCVPKYRLKSSQSSIELISNKSAIDESGDSGNVTPTSPSCQIHPLDSCLGVNFSYSGTTKLKTIRPLRSNLARNTSCDNLMPLKPIDSPQDTNPSTQKEQQSLAYVMGQTNNNLLTR